MTNAEKQEIIEAVLAALATNSKTIAQLSPKQSLIDSDLFEVAGGSRVTYQTLRSLIREGLALESQLSNYVTGDAAMMYLAKLDTETGTVDYKESPLVMLDGFKGVNGYTPVTGDLYYENWSGYQIWIKAQGGAQGVVANTHVAYVNMNDGAIYRWTGSTMVRIGGSAVVNDLTTGGEADALSAEMGKTLMVAIQQILGSLGNYAFPGGKPTIDWGGSSSVTYSVTYPTDSKVTHSGAGDTVELGASLEVTLGIASGNDLYVIKDSSVKVYMGGVEQSGAYNASTQKVTLASVIGNVVIVAEAWTYVQNGLAFQLDGKNRGGTYGHWVDLINNIDFTLGGQTEFADHVAFDGGSSSGGEASTSASLDVDDVTSTVEAVYELTNDLSLGEYCNLLRNKTSGKVCMGFMKGQNQFNHIYALQATHPSSTTCFSPAICANTSTVYMKGFLSIRTKAIVSGGTLSSEEGGYFNGERTLSSITGATLGLADRLMLMKSAGSHTAGKLYSIRVYSRRLTDAEILQNYAIDQKRFNLA